MHNDIVHACTARFWKSLSSESAVELTLARGCMRGKSEEEAKHKRASRMGASNAELCGEMVRLRWAVSLERKISSNNPGDRASFDEGAAPFNLAAALLPQRMRPRRNDAPHRAGDVMAG